MEEEKEVTGKMKDPDLGIQNFQINEAISPSRSPELTWLKRCSRQPCSLSCLSEEILMSHGSSSPSNGKIKNTGQHVSSVLI